MLMDFVRWWTTERAGVAIASGALVTAVPSLISARRDRKERDRPMVALELRLGPADTRSLVLVMRNYGPTIAHNVSVKFTPDLPDAGPNSMIEAVKRRYANPIPTLTPGQELSQVWGHFGEGTLTEGVPMRVTATVTSFGSRTKPYTDDFVLAADVLGETTSSEASTSTRNRIGEINKHLKGVEGYLKLVANYQAGMLRQHQVTAASRPRDPEDPCVLLWYSGATYELINAGPTPMADVEISAPQLHLRGDLQHPSIPAGGSVTFRASRSMNTSDDHVNVTWSLQDGSPGSWSGLLPPGD